MVSVDVMQIGVEGSGKRAVLITQCLVARATLKKIVRWPRVRVSLPAAQRIGRDLSLASAAQLCDTMQVPFAEGLKESIRKRELELAAPRRVLEAQTFMRIASSVKP